MAKLLKSNSLDLKRGSKVSNFSWKRVNIGEDISISERDCSAWILKVRMSNISNFFYGFLDRRRKRKIVQLMIRRPLLFPLNTDFPPRLAAPDESNGNTEK